MKRNKAISHSFSKLLELLVQWIARITEVHIYSVSFCLTLNQIYYKLMKHAKKKKINEIKEKKNKNYYVQRTLCPDTIHSQSITILKM